MRIRELSPDERSTISLPIQAYAFQASPEDDALRGVLERNQNYYTGNVNLVAEEEDGVAVADVSGIPMQQNVRGATYQMAGIAGLATLPQARLRGYARELLTELLDRMRETGHVVSALYPFRPSFYQRFGYIGLPRTRTVRFSPASLADLLHRELSGEVTRESARRGYQAYRTLTERLLKERHGFSVLPEFRTVELCDTDDRWIALAWTGCEVIGATTYRITGHNGVLEADDFLTTSPLGKALLLQFFARHIDQVSEVEVQVDPQELPELWATDLVAMTQATTSFPESPAPMARVLSLNSLAGMPTGRERVTVEVEDDDPKIKGGIEGRYLLDGRAGSLEVAADATLEPEVKLTTAGLSALVYGVLDPDDVALRGLGDVPRDPAARLRQLFPRLVPYLYAKF
jgi:predicted acetyltransferase